MSIEAIKNFRDSRIFSNITTAIILIYASILGFRTFQELTQPVEYIFFYLDFAVTIYFLIELIIKISTEERKRDFFKSGWNIFDFIIVVVSLIPAGSGNYALIARLLRVFKILRLFDARPQLKGIIDMLFKAIPSILDIVILMFIIFYVYAIIGSFIFKDLESGLWSNFLVAMLTLFRVLTFEDWTDVMYEAMELHQWAWVYFVSFVIIAAFVFFNLFVAVIIGEMQKMQEKDIRESLKDEGEQIQHLREDMKNEHCEITALRSEVKELNRKIDLLLKNQKS